MKFRNLSGTFLMAVFGLISLGRSLETGLLFFLLLALRDFIASYFFFARSEPYRNSSKFMSLIAYASSGLPLFYSGIPIVVPIQTQLLASLLVIGGFTIAALATIELANRMGISPAVRGEICRSGAYRFFAHPMYLGYIIAEIGIVIGNFENLSIFVVSVILYLVRMRAESNILKKSRTGSQPAC